MRMKLLNLEIKFKDMANYIRIETHDENHTKVEINGNGGQLIDMVASAIVNDLNFGMIILAAMQKLAEEKNNPINNINLN